MLGEAEYMPDEWQMGLQDRWLMLVDLWGDEPAQQMKNHRQNREA